VEKYVEKRGPLYRNGYNEVCFSFLPIKKAAIPSLNHKWELACPFNEKATQTNPPKPVKPQPEMKHKIFIEQDEQDT
jgi:hypothetical protein